MADNDMKKPFYITTTLPYVNDDPHIGHVLEFVQADIFARYKRLMGHPVFFNTGTDEHGQKVYKKALEAGESPQEYADRYAERFKNLKETLDLSFDNFIRTTDEHHKKSAQAFWEKANAAGDIEKKVYKVKYCVSCEMEKSDSELTGGACSMHPNKELEIREEENYFFKLTKYRQQLLDLYASDVIVPDWRAKEAMQLVESDKFSDFSISRVKEKMPWGVPVPGDESQVMYVWFDALVNYVSAIGWPDDMEKFEKWWPVIQFAGKDQVRPQSVMWQGMLMSAGLAPSKKIFYHGFINLEGQKMSKSVGNVIDPFALVDEYGTDALRYYLARHVHPVEDTDYSDEKFKEAYNANLANGLGNLVSRLLTLGEKYLDEAPEIPEMTIPEDWKEEIENFRFDRACDIVWRWVGELDAEIAEKEPYKVVKDDLAAGQEMLRAMLVKLYTIGRMLNPIMPETNARIKELIKANKKPEQPLFVRKD